MKGFRKAKTKMGVTLVEVMVAMFAMTFVILMFAATLPMAAKTSKMNGNYAQAVSLCQHKIDQLRAVGYGRLTYTELKNAEIIDPSPSTSPYSFKDVDELSSFFANSQGTIEITDFAAGIKKVTVTVTWSGSGIKQAEGSYTLVALIAKE